GAGETGRHSAALGLVGHMLSARLNMCGYRRTISCPSAMYVTPAVIGSNSPSSRTSPETVATFMPFMRRPRCPAEHAPRLPFPQLGSGFRRLVCERGCATRWERDYLPPGREKPVG